MEEVPGVTIVRIIPYMYISFVFYLILFRFAYFNYVSEFCILLAVARMDVDLKPRRRAGD